MIAVSIDGELVAPEHATISIFDRGFAYGDGVFEVASHVGWRRGRSRSPFSRGCSPRRSCPACARPVRSSSKRAPGRTPEAAGPGNIASGVALDTRPGPLSARPDALGPGRAIVVVEPLLAQLSEPRACAVDYNLWRAAAATRHSRISTT
jgi:hypothetical protein